jgi:hypothetical protein
MRREKRKGNRHYPGHKPPSRSLRLDADVVVVVVVVRGKREGERERERGNRSE